MISITSRAKTSVPPPGFTWTTNSTCFDGKDCAGARAGASAASIPASVKLKRRMQALVFMVSSFMMLCDYTSIKTVMGDG